MREYFSVEAAFPSVEALGVQIGGGTSVIVGVSEKDVAGSRYLRIEQRSEKEKCKSGAGKATQHIGLPHWSSRSDADIYKQLEPEDNAGRQAQIILSRAEE